MKIITKSLTRADLYEIIFKLEPVSIDLTLNVEFLTKDEELISIQQLQAEFDKIQTTIPLNHNFCFPELEIFFSRAYHLFLLLFCIKNRKATRVKLADFLVLLLNKRIKNSTYFSKPYSILYSFYGENSVSAIIDSLSKLPSLTKSEKELLQPFQKSVPIKIRQVLRRKNKRNLGQPSRPSRNLHVHLKHPHDHHRPFPPQQLRAPQNQHY